PEFLAPTVTAGTQAVVVRALGRIAEHFVGLVDRLEAVLGVGFLADVGVVLAREPAVRGLDLGRARVRLHAEGFVVVGEAHVLWPWVGNAAPCRQRSSIAARERSPAAGRRRVSRAADAVASAARGNLTAPGCGAAWFRASSG